MDVLIVPVTESDETLVSSIVAKPVGSAPPKQELETLKGQIAARLTINAIMAYPVIANACRPYFE